MPQTLNLVVTLQKEVDTVEQGQQVYDLVKVFLADKPDVRHTAHVSTTLVDDE